MATSTKSPQLATSVTIPQAHKIPGYGGFCPTVRTNYGSTYGTATKTFYQLSRKNSLNTSVKPIKRSQSEGGISIGNLAIVAQQRPFSASKTPEGNPWAKPLPYSLHLEGPRRDNIFQFNKSVQMHRHFYKDHSGIVQGIPAIHQRRHSLPIVEWRSSFSSQSIPRPVGSDTFSQLKSTTGFQYLPSSRRGSARERSTRNAFFEKR